jgi:hypothetical protein
MLIKRRKNTIVIERNLNRKLTVIKKNVQGLSFGLYKEIIEEIEAKETGSETISKEQYDSQIEIKEKVLNEEINQKNEENLKVESQTEKNVNENETEIKNEKETKNETEIKNETDTMDISDQKIDKVNETELKKQIMNKDEELEFENKRVKKIHLIF